MTEEIHIEQNIEKGKDNTSIAVQNNYYGSSLMSATEVCQAAFTMFRDYYPQLKDELLKDLQRLVEQEINRIPTENIVPPTARIAVPTLQKASITEEVEIRELYANLLANSMNKALRDGIHPSYVEVINQLTPDEAKILGYFKFNSTVPIITLRYENTKKEGFEIIKNFSNIGELTNCEYPLEINKYFDNLIRLGLIERSTMSSLTNKELYDTLKNHEYILQYANKASTRDDEYNQIKFKEGFVSITDYGKSFCHACLPNVIKITLKQ